MTRPKARNLSTLTPEELQARCEELCFEKPKITAYNAVIEGVDILYEAANEGNTEASKRLRHLAEEATRAVADEGPCLKKSVLTVHNSIVVALEALYDGIAEENPEASKRLAHLAEQVIRAAADKNL